MNWRRSLFLSAFAFLVLAAVAAAGVGLRAHGLASRHPLSGKWHALIVMDSMRGPGREGERGRQATATADGSVELAAGWPPGEPLGWFRRGYQGRHSLRLERLTGMPARDGASALGWRYGEDSVRAFLGGSCCHSNGLVVVGRIRGDTVEGHWTTDSDGWGAWGSIVLVRAGAT